MPTGRASFFFDRWERSGDMDDEKVIAMGCLGLLIMLALPSVALITLVICKILDNMIPPV